MSLKYRIAKAACEQSSFLHLSVIKLHFFHVSTIKILGMRLNTAASRLTTVAASLSYIYYI